MSSWNEKPEQVGPGNSAGGGWLTLKEGTYHLRLVSDYVYIGYHFDNATKKSSVCPNRTKIDDECELCRMFKDKNGKLYSRDEVNDIQKEKPEVKFYYNKPSQKFLANVLDLDEETPTVKHVEFPFKVVDMLTGYAISSDYGFSELPEWDMTIIRKNGDTKTQVDYQVLPARTNRKLTELEMEAVDESIKPSVIVEKKHKYSQENEIEEKEPVSEDEPDEDKPPF